MIENKVLVAELDIVFQVSSDFAVADVLNICEHLPCNSPCRSKHIRIMDSREGNK